MKVFFGDDVEIKTTFTNRKILSYNMNQIFSITHLFLNIDLECEWMAMIEFKDVEKYYGKFHALKT